MKHFIHLNDFSKQEIFQIFELADKLKADNGECDWLKGKAIVLFFPESSIRTRVSFEKGIKMLGGDTILFPPEALDKKEDIKDKTEIKGIVMRVKNTKNKIANPFREALIKLYFDNGIDSEDEYLDYLVSLGLVTQKGAWFSNDEWGMKVAGKNGMAQFLKEKPELFEEVKKQINDIILGRNVLDDHQTLEKGEVLDNGIDMPHNLNYEVRNFLENEDWEGGTEVEE